MTRVNVNASSSKPGAFVQLGVPELWLPTSRAVRISSSFTTKPPSIRTKWPLPDGVVKSPRSLYWAEATQLTRVKAISVIRDRVIIEPIKLKLHCLKNQYHKRAVD